MNSNRKNAIVAGILFISATAAGILSVVFTNPILDAPDYLIKISANENRVIIGALFELVMAFAIAGIPIWLYPVLRKYNEALALGSVGFRLIEAVLFIVVAAGQLSLLTLSQEYLKAGTPNASDFQTLGALILAVRDRAGFLLGPIAFSLGALMYYYVFYRSKLIPRWLSGWGLIAIILHLSAALLTFGTEPFSTTSLVLNLPIFLNEMVLAVWLIVKGFNSSAIAPEIQVSPPISVAQSFKETAEH